jgi:hypothetical protein
LLDMASSKRHKRKHDQHLHTVDQVFEPNTTTSDHSLKQDPLFTMKGVQDSPTPIELRPTGVLYAEATELSDLKTALERERKARQLAEQNAKEAKNTSIRVEKQMNAIFETIGIGVGNQVQSVVRTRDGATLNVINPSLDHRMASIETFVAEELEDLRGGFEEVRDRSIVKQDKPRKKGFFNK